MIRNIIFKRFKNGKDPETYYLINVLLTYCFMAFKFKSFDQFDE